MIGRDENNTTCWNRSFAGAQTWYVGTVILAITGTGNATLLDVIWHKGNRGLLASQPKFLTRVKKLFDYDLQPAKKEGRNRGRPSWMRRTFINRFAFGADIL